MDTPIFVFDPTAADKLSRVRGIGRYLQTLHENFSDEFTFVRNTADVPQNAVFINPFFDMLKPPVISKPVALKHIAVIHDVIPQKYPTHFPIGIKGRIRMLQNKFALRTYDAVITDSEASKQDIVNILHIPEKLVYIVYPTIQKAYYYSEGSASQPLPHNLQPQSYFIYAADATWNKNIVTIAKAVQKTDVTCVFTGSVFAKQHAPEALNNPWLADLKEFLQLTGGDSRFIFPGFVSDESLMVLYRNAIANILVSRDEGFGLSYVEAAALHTPTIAARTPVQQEIAKDAALFVPPEHENALGQAITELKNNQELREDLAEKAHTRSLDFHPDIFRKRYFNVLNELV